MTTLTATLEERVGDTTIRHVREDIQHAGEGAAESTAPEPKTRLLRFLENAVAKRLGHRHLLKLAANRASVTAAWRELPDRMHLAANQTKLMMELVDDFRAGTYRKIPWHSLAIGVAAILYAANPADVLPDMVVGLGLLDDIVVAALAARVLRKDLMMYCEFKGYAVDDYFKR
ncbi:MAG TPA: DUF1232 domain-containing protein [Polyangiales bacterium]|nr:DUF1232 domain-containing protein [Polyangiales bacterium]